MRNARELVAVAAALVGPADAGVRRRRPACDGREDEASRQPRAVGVDGINGLPYCVLRPPDPLIRW